MRERCSKERDRLSSRIFGVAGLGRKRAWRALRLAGGEGLLQTERAH